MRRGRELARTCRNERRHWLKRIMQTAETKQKLILKRHFFVLCEFPARQSSVISLLRFFLLISGFARGGKLYFYLLYSLVIASYTAIQSCKVFWSCGLLHLLHPIIYCCSEVMVKIRYDIYGFSARARPNQM